MNRPYGPLPSPHLYGWLEPLFPSPLKGEGKRGNLACEIGVMG